MLLAHALFKATLFLVVGIIDHQHRHPRPARAQRSGPAGTGAGGDRRAGRRVDGRAAAAGRVRRQGGGVRGVPPRAAAATWWCWPGWSPARRSPSPTALRFLWGAFADQAGRRAGRPGPPRRLAVPAARRCSPLPGWSSAPPPPAARRAAAPVRRPVPGAGARYHLALWHGLDPAAGAVGAGAGRPAARCSLLHRGRLRGAGAAAVRRRHRLRAGDRRAGPARRRAHRRHPARLAAVLPRDHPAGAGRAARAASLLARRPWPDRRPRSGTPRCRPVVAAW